MHSGAVPERAVKTTNTAFTTCPETFTRLLRPRCPLLPSLTAAFLLLPFHSLYLHPRPCFTSQPYFFVSYPAYCATILGSQPSHHHGRQKAVFSLLQPGSFRTTDYGQKRLFTRCLSRALALKWQAPKSCSFTSTCTLWPIPRSWSAQSTRPSTASCQRQRCWSTCITSSDLRPELLKTILEGWLEAKHILRLNNRRLGR